jgi:hypothetical protein
VTSFESFLAIQSARDKMLSAGAIVLGVAASIVFGENLESPDEWSVQIK